MMFTRFPKTAFIPMRFDDHKRPSMYFSRLRGDPELKRRTNRRVLVEPCPVGAMCGEETGVFVLDVDMKDKGM